MQKKLSNYEMIYNDFFNAITSKQYEKGDKLPTENELCDKYLVSRTTVQRALNQLVDNGMVERISGKGSYVRQEKASKVAPKAMLGVIMCDISVSYGLGLFRAIEHYAYEKGYSVIYKDSDFDMQKETQAIKDLIKLGVDAIILQPLHAEMFNETILKLSLQNYPIVLLDREMAGLSLSFVGSDNSSIVKQVVKHLFEKGHEKICFVSSDPNNTTTIMDRLLAFNNTFIEENVQNYSTNLYTKITSTRSRRTTRDLIEQDIVNLINYLSSNPQITCLFAAEYSIGILIKQALKRMNKHIPEDISLVTFDNIYDDFFITSTSYIKQNEREIGKTAVELIEEIKENHRRIVKIIPCDFISNESVKKIN